MKYTSDELGVSFSLPDTLTIRQQINFRGRVLEESGSYLMRFWAAAASLFQDWECDIIPDPATLDVDEVTDVQAAKVVTWAASEAAGWWTELNEVGPN